MLSLDYLPNKIFGEKVVKVVRKDVFVLIKKALLFAVLLILPTLFYEIIITSQFDVEASNLVFASGVLLTSVYYLFVWIFAFFSFVDYYLDVWIITDKRIIDIEQQGYFSRVISEHRLYQVQDASSEVKGVFATVLKFGTLYVQTAGTKQRFVFEEIPDPDGVRNLIIKLSEKDKKRERGK